LEGQCKPCLSVRNHEYYKKNKASHYAKGRAWVKSNPEAWKRLMRRADLKEKYGLTVAAYDALLSRQGNACAVCNIHMQSLRRRLAVDHCHVTSKIRGLLCDECNMAIGLLKDRPELLRIAAIYLEAA
jgi:hypothetical protein